jgi:hypothetical protein
LEIVNSTQYRKIDGRRMRSLADALERLRELGSLHRDDEVEIRAWSFPMPDGRRAGFVWVLGPADPDGLIPVIEMPPAAVFNARTTCGRPVSPFVSLLNQARCDARGNVRLGNGEYLHSVHLIPAPAHYELSPREDAILLAALYFLNKHEECYPEVYGRECPGVRAFRADRIFQVRVENLQELWRKINSILKRPVSLSIMTKALKRAGMQLPHARQGSARLPPK